jgi:carbonic anhydrase
LLDNAAAEQRATAGGSTEKLAAIVQKLYSSKKIDIVGGVYELATGKIALV